VRAEGGYAISFDPGSARAPPENAPLPMRTHLPTILCLVPLCLAAKGPVAPVRHAPPALHGPVEPATVVPCFLTTHAGAPRDRFTLERPWSAKMQPASSVSIDAGRRAELAVAVAGRIDADELQPFLEVESVHGDDPSQWEESAVCFGLTGSDWRIGLQWSGESEFYGDGIQNEDSIAIGVGLRF